MLVQDATRFLLRHYQILATWPSQAYSSVIVFSPQTSVVRRDNLDKVPTWLRKLPQIEDEWTSLIQTLVGHSYSVNSVTFSPDGKQIASGSDDTTIKLWDTTTGNLQKTLVGHSGSVDAIAFSPDSKQIASGSRDGIIKLWDAITGDLRKTFTGHSNCRVWSVAFSPDGKQIASGSDDKTIKLWDVTKSLKVSKFLGSTLGSHLKFRGWREIKTSEPVSSLKFSLDGRYLITKLGEIKIENNPTSRQSFDLESLKNLWVSNQWVYYGAVPVFLLPTDFEIGCYDVKGDQVAIGLRNGRVLSFDIDRMSLDSIYKHLA